MEETLNDFRLVLIKQDGSDGILFCPTKKSILIGSDTQCDIRINNQEVSRKHFAIYVDSSGKVKLTTSSSAKAVLVNDEAVDGKCFLQCGDIINVFGCKMRWESKSEAKRRSDLLTKSERRANKKNRIKTKHRVTIHRINLMQTTTTIDNQESGPATQVHFESPAKEEHKQASTPTSTPQRIEKENLPSPFLRLLNLSGTLLTSYTPKPTTKGRSSSRTATPKRLNMSTTSSVFESPSESVFKVTESNNLSFHTPDSKGKKSMHLIDFTTPAPSVLSTTSKTLTPKKTPSKTVMRFDKTLLKSALKNSTMKKVEATPNRKTLTFAGPADESLNITTDSYSSSVIEVSSVLENVKGDVKDEELDSTNLSEAVRDEEPQATLKTPARAKERKTLGFTNYTGVGSLLQTPADDENKQTSDEEFQDLIDNISSVLDEKDIANASDESLDKFAKKADDRSQNVEKNSEDVLKLNQLSATDSTSDNKFVKLQDFDSLQFEDNELADADKQFDSLIGRPSINRTYSARKPSTPDVSQMEVGEVNEAGLKERAEAVFKWMDGVRESFTNESNQTEQVLSSRYSNVTPNDSIVNTTMQHPGTTSTPYDPAKAKVSILHTVEHLRKSCGNVSTSKVNRLAMSPVTRLSVSENNTVVVENYHVSSGVNVNSEMPKSLRSTRKRIGNAMASLNDISQVADTTIDPNETMNVSADEARLDLDQSKSEEADILSLDAPQSNNMEINNQPEGVPQQEAAKANVLYQYTNDETDETPEIFEVNDSEDDDNETQSQSGDEDEESSESDAEPEEVEEIEDESLVVDGGRSLKFHLTENDLEEGINPLEDSVVDESQEITQDLSQNETCEGTEDSDLDASLVEDLTSSQSQEIDQELEDLSLIGVQKELANVQDQPTVTRRGASLTPERVAKGSDSRKTLAPGAVNLDELSESFIEHVEIQKELANVQDQPNVTRRGASLTPERVVKAFDSRKTLAPGAVNEELSESFIEHVEIKKDLAKVQDQPTVARRGASLTPERVAKGSGSRKTLAPGAVNEELSESFIEHVEIHKELVKVQVNLDAMNHEKSLTPEGIASPEWEFAAANTTTQILSAGKVFVKEEYELTSSPETRRVNSKKLVANPEPLEKARITEEPSVMATPVKGRRGNSKKQSANPVSAENSEPIKEETSATVASPAKGRRPNSRKPAKDLELAETAPEDETPSTATSARSRRENSKKVTDVVDQDATPVKRSRGRQHKIEVIPEEIQPEVPTKRTRERRAVTVDPEPAKVEITPAKRAASKKKATFATPSTAEAAKEVDVPKSSRKKLANSEVEEAGEVVEKEPATVALPFKGRKGNSRKPVKSTELAETTPENETPSTTTSVRSRRGNSKIVTDVDQDATPVKRSRGRQHKIEVIPEETQPEVPTKRTRERRAVTVDPEPAKVEITPAKRATSKKKLNVVTPSTAEAAKEVEVPKSSRKKRANSEVEEVDDEEPAAVAPPVKSRRGNSRKPAKASELAETTPEEETPSTTSVRSRRGKSKKATDVADQDATPAERSRGQEDKIEAIPKETQPEVPTKRTRERRVATVDPEPAKAESTPAKRATSKKKLNVVTPSTAEAAKEVEVPKSSRKKRANSEVEEAAPATKRSMRSKKLPQKFQ